MKMTKFTPDPALAVAIYGSAALDSAEAIDSDNPAGDDAADDATLGQPFELFFTQAALQNLGLCKSDDPARTSLAKAGVPRKFGIARVETREIDNTIWAVAFDADGNLVDQQEIGPGPLGKRSGSDGWDDEFVPSTSSLSSDFQKRSNTKDSVIWEDKTRVWLRNQMALGKTPSQTIDGWCHEYPHRDPSIEADLRRIAAEL